MASGVNPTDPDRLREGIEKYERATHDPRRIRYSHGGGRIAADETLVADFYDERNREYGMHVWDDYPALARAHLELLEAATAEWERIKFDYDYEDEQGWAWERHPLYLALPDVAPPGSAAVEAPDAARTGAETEER